MNRRTWMNTCTWPLKGRKFGAYASIYHEKAFYIFGGSSFDSEYPGWVASSQIGRLDAVTRTWSLAGSLKQAREGHAVAFDGKQFLVIGGVGDLKTENCTPNRNTITCTENQSPGLNNYSYYPELLLVADNYGNDC